MTLHWFSTPRLGETVEDALRSAAPFGVRLGRCREVDVMHFFSAEANGILAQIGRVLACDDGRIILLGNRGTTNAMRHQLIGAGVNAFRNKPSKATGWIRRRVKTGSYWWSEILVRVPDDDQVAQAVMAARATHALEDRARVMDISAQPIDA